MRFLALYPLLFCAAAASAQTPTLSLDQALEAARRHHPNSAKIGLEAEASHTRSESISAEWLPGVQLNGQVGYQSLVPEIPIRMPGVTPPAIPKDRYQVSLDVNQLIYDGGSLSLRQDLNVLDSEIAQKRLEMGRFPVEQQVAENWFRITLVDQRLASLRLVRQEIDDRLATARNRFAEGLVLRSDVAALEAERIKLDQQETGLKADRSVAVATLARLTGLEIQDGTDFIAVNGPSDLARDVVWKRPELTFYELSRQRADASVDLRKSQFRPAVQGFAQAAYAKPGLDMFSDQFNAFWQAGLKASWTIWDRGAVRRERELAKIQRRSIDEDEVLFRRNVELALDQLWAEVAKQRSLIDADRRLVELQEEVVGITRARFDDGLVTSTDYLAQVRALDQARLQLDLRNIQIESAYVSIRILTGQP